MEGSRVRALSGFAAGVLALVSAFFAFYTVRLLVVTHGLQATRAGGDGAYVGAAVFPVLAILCGWGGWRCARAARRSGRGA
jgi:hypothetical protein